MSYAKTKKELDQYYNLGVRHFAGAQMMGVIYLTKPEVIAKLLPPPLEPADMPRVLIFIAQYPETNLGPGYREAALYLTCQYGGEEGTYCLSMPITAESRMHNGRDIFGLPKKMADIHLEKDEQKVHGWVEREGVRFIDVSIELTGTLPSVPATGPSFTFKAMPKIDLTPGFDGPVFLARQHTDVEMRSFDIGVPVITLRDSQADPWAEVSVEQPMLGFYMISDNTMQPGKILCEVDPDAFLPHYFKMTDFSTGA